MALKVLAGDFPIGSVAAVPLSFLGNPKYLTLRTGMLKYNNYKSDDFLSVTQINQQNQTSIMAKLGWGGIGALALGPLGMIAGALGGGNKSTAVVAVEFKDGKRAMLEGKTKEITHVIALGFGASVE
jgi:hypothetical protein